MGPVFSPDRVSHEWGFFVAMLTLHSTDVCYRAIIMRVGQQVKLLLDFTVIGGDLVDSTLHSVDGKIPMFLYPFGLSISGSWPR